MNNYKTHLKLDLNESLPIVSFACSNYLNREFFRANGDARQYCILNQVNTPVSNLSTSIRKKIFKKFGINIFQEEPMFGIFLGVNNEGGSVHEHTDPTITGFYHLRINFLLSKPLGGGMPVINGNEFHVNEGESWINLASEWLHKSTPVIGTKPRIVLSLGGLVEKYLVDSILSKKGISV